MPVVQAEKCKVYVAAQSRLAALYLYGILGEDKELCVAPIDDVVAHTPQGRSPFAFVLDRTGLSPPVGEWLRVLRMRYASGRFIVVDEARAPEEVANLLPLGIHGYVPYEQVAEQLSQAIHCVVAGKMWISKNILEAHAQRSLLVIDGSHAGRVDCVTRREDEVMELVRQRLSNREIASALGVTESTVKFHISNILSKLQMKRRASLHGRTQIAEVWNRLTCKGVGAVCEERKSG